MLLFVFLIVSFFVPGCNSSEDNISDGSSEVKLVWAKEVETQFTYPTVVTPAIDGSLVYYARNAEIVCAELATGKEKWVSDFSVAGIID